MKVLLTGGAGFIGSNLADEYIKAGYEVVVVDNLITGKQDQIHPMATFYEADICSEEFYQIALKEKPDLINHHAANIDVQSSIINPGLDAKINIIGTLNVLEVCKQLGVPIIYPSSAAVYGTPNYLGIDEIHEIAPISNYGISKYTPEQYIKLYHGLYNVPYTIFRYANVYGMRQDPKGEGGVISVLMKSAINGQDFNLYGDGKQTRDFIHVADVVKANLLASATPLNDIFNISTGTQTELLQLINLVKETVKTQFHVHYLQERKGDIKHSYLLNDKVKEKLGWKPTIDLLEGINRTYQYYLNK
ncbi:NAD-dependent epimerase/dehydratase family protein [Metabacillus sediminilitoris]|uniref:NAD-dependent epimerase/dehydratase family protein n=1 Tax=Metabacillus sediminilitoris TaxID=2567941 RepID=A0A4S4C1U7_9BACI|nr:NAD-dependent epimerase/dehydratase family protein [Metabacillus sediminilitoris]QGQ48159.1 NAD-dependent epimerase/dehydratase family protein [Metabacillus sediminilitoris]THF81478.1 NAD-dependent epimerase/dehydratase family protein [Metabacillus sediminilitoris]